MSRPRVTLADQPESQPAWRLAFGLAALALAAHVLLAGTAVTFLAGVALAGAGPAAIAFNFHHPAALVRLFALLRTGARYGERMAGHRAALIDQVWRRAGLFAAQAWAPESRAAGWQLGRPERLADYIDDVADIDYARLRVGFPLATTGTALLGLIAFTAFAAPIALLPIGLLALIVGLVARRSAHRLVAYEVQVRQLRRRAASDLGAALAGIVPLDAEGRRLESLQASFSPLGAAERMGVRTRRTLVCLETLLGLTAPVAAVSVLIAAWSAGARGTALLPAGFLAFAWIALAEPILGLARALSGSVRARLAGESVAIASEPGAVLAPSSVAFGDALAVEGLALRAPDGRILGKMPDFVVRPGAPVVLFGQSGCGKTTLLKMIAGWDDDQPGEAIRLGGAARSAVERRASIHLGLHDAAVLADTVRENLFAPGVSDGAMWAALECVELDGRIRSGGGLDGWIADGVLSLGEAQRLNLARALLSPAPVILLDEPAEHLGDDQATRVLDRLLVQLRDRVVVLTSHRPDLAIAAERIWL